MTRIPRWSAARSTRPGLVAQSAHSKVDIVSAVMIRKPPYVGVPFLRSRCPLNIQAANRLTVAGLLPPQPQDQGADIG